MSIADESFIAREAPHLPIKAIDDITVRGLGSSMHATNKIVVAELRASGKTPSGEAATAIFQVELHLVKDLKPNMLIGIDALGPQEVVINTKQASMTIGRCHNTIIPISIRPRGNKRIELAVRTKAKTVVPPRSFCTIPIEVKQSELPNDRDLLFEPSKTSLAWGDKGGLFTHVVDANLTEVHAYNATNVSLTLQRHLRLGDVVDYEQTDCFLAATQDRHLAIAPRHSDMQLMPMQLETSSFLPKRHQENETVLCNGITIHGNEAQATLLADLVFQFASLWDTPQFINIPEDQYMTIPLIDDWQAKAKFPPKVYPLGQRQRAKVDEVFDELHGQGKMAWSHQPTPFGCPVFVVSQNTAEGIKDRVVVDIRPLNQISQRDNHPLPLQEDIISEIAGFPYITVVDGTAFFHQFRVAEVDRPKLAVNTHRGQEIFNVVVMGHCNSVAYVQRQIETILREHRPYCKPYVDDIVIFSKTLRDHLYHLTCVFTTLQAYNVKLSPKKSFIAFPSLTILGHKVDSLSMATHEDKIEAIQALAFPKSLAQLERYLGMTGWLRKYVRGYAAIARPLTDRKTMLLRQLVKGSKHRKAAAAMTLTFPTADEIKAFNYLQHELSSSLWLTHFDPKRILFFDVDASKEVGLGAIAYHSTNDANNDHDAIFMMHTTATVEPIAFLSRDLTPAERNYWITELEVAAVVWILRKMKHNIDTARKTVIYTDHNATVGIAKATTLCTSSSDRSNLRLIRASQYISQFQNLEIRYKAGNINTVPDALSRLIANRTKPATTSDDGELEHLSAQGYCVAVEAKLGDNLLSQIKEGYQTDPQWKDVIKTVRNIDSPHMTASGEHVFFWHEDLLYYSDDLGRRRICIPKAMTKNVFDMAHDQRHHTGFQRTYHFLCSSVYIVHMAKKLRDYIAHCPVCALNKTTRHQPFGSLKPILTPAVPGHTITIDFIAGLPPAEGFDMILSVTDKFSKHIDLLPGKTTFTAADWASLLINRCFVNGLGQPAVIISDRDRKFLGKFWTGMHQALGTRLIMTTAYHPSADGQSERTNQTAEIAIRHLLFSKSEHEQEWPKLLPMLQAQLNNSISATTKLSPSEMIIGYNVSEGNPLMDNHSVPTDLVSLRETNRREANEAIVFAAEVMKAQYNAKHKAITFNEGDQVFINLRHAYHIQSLRSHPKFKQQRIGPFKVLQKVGKLAYKLDLPAEMRIDPVVSIAHLEPAPNNDPYERTIASENPPVTYADDGEPLYEIEAIVGHQRRRFGRQAEPSLRFRVRWSGYGPEHDS